MKTTKTTNANNETIKESTYKLEVINPHQVAKQFFGTLSGCRSKLLATENLPPYMSVILKRSKTFLLSILSKEPGCLVILS